MTTKVRPPIVERRVAGMASKDDAAECRCLRLGTSATRNKFKCSILFGTQNHECNANPTRRKWQRHLFNVYKKKLTSKMTTWSHFCTVNIAYKTS